MIIEIFKDSKGEFRFRIKSRNGRIIAQSEGYKRKVNIKQLIYRAFYEKPMKYKDLTK